MEQVNEAAEPPFIFAEKFEGWFIAPGEEGYDCPNCQMSKPVRRAYPDGLKAVQVPCDEHARP